MACCRHLKSLGTVAVRLAGGLSQADGVGGSSVASRRTSFTMSAGDINTRGGPGHSNSFLEETLLLGGL